MSPRIGKADGGFISGSGSGTSDQIPAMLSNGEYVIKQAAVARHGKGFFDQINNGTPSRKASGQVQKFAEGGLVGPIISGMISPIMSRMMTMALSKLEPSGSVATGDPGKYGDTMMTAEQLRNAATIIDVGTKMSMDRRDILSGLMTAMQESRLINVNYGADDSLGLFQQRATWGSAQDRMTPEWAAKQYYLRLRDVPDRDELTLGEMAQKVQISAFPSYYTQWADEARAIFKSATFGGAGMDDPKRAKMVNFAENQLGEPYVFGAAGPNSWDCSGLTMAAAAQVGIGLAHAASQQWAATSHIGASAAEAGDLVFFNPGSSGAAAGLPGHVGLMTGNTGFIHAANSSLPVLRGDLRTTTNDYVGMGRIPGLRSGGKINYDNTIANLHRGETVLTAPLTKNFEDNVANSGGNNYNFNVDTIELHKEMDLEREFMKFTTAHERQQERRNGRGRSI
jgi:cell wall-associated NlpC family hydrolase